MACLGAASCSDKAVKPAIPVDSEIEKAVEKTLSKMTVEEKIGQMSEIAIDILGNSTSGVADERKFELNEESLEKIMSTFKVGSVLNAPGKALPAEEWNTIIEKINASSIEHTGIATLYGIDAIHGTTYTWGATLFPQEVNAAASFNRALTRQMAEMTAYEAAKRLAELGL